MQTPYDDPRSVRCSRLDSCRPWHVDMFAHIFLATVNEMALLIALG
jgi:hypothetical protein